MTALAFRVGWISLTTSAVLLPLLLLAGPICRRYRAKSCYLLWLLLALRLLIPVEVPLPQTPVTVELPAQQMAVLELSVEGERSAAVPSEDVPVVSEKQTRSPAAVVSRIWAIGVVLLAAVQWIQYSTIKKQLWKHSAVFSEDEKVLARFGVKVPVRRGDVASPMTFGLLCPAIFLPRELPEEDVPMVLRHEVCHLRRGDLWYKGLFLLCGCVHWFNPLVWKLGRVAGAHLELCCDEDVVAGQDTRFRKEYGQLLLRSAAAVGTVMPATGLGGSDLKGRLMNLFTQKKRGTALVCAAVCAALMLGSLVGCEVQQPTPPPEESVGKEIVSTGLSDLPEQESTAEPSQSSAAEEPLYWPVEGEYLLSALHVSRTHPVTGEVSSHNGLDIVAPEGTKVQAALSGVVTEADFDKQYGNYVLIAHDNGKSTLYCHMKECLVEEGDAISREQIIGIVGRTGVATGAHLHFELRQDGEPVDPIAQYPDARLKLIMDGQKEPLPVEHPVVFN